MMALFAVFACERVEELSRPEKEQEVIEKVAMTMEAVIESDDTRTVLVDSDVENVKKVFWQPGDAIGVSASNASTYGRYVSVEKFTSTLESPEKRSDFTGNIQTASSYKAFYPYTETLKDSCDIFYFDVPSVQNYVKGSFDPDAALMVAFAEYGQVFNFKNLGSVLGLRLTGEELVKSISFSAYNEFGQPAPLSGRFRVSPTSESLQMEPYGKQGYTLTLNCDEPVQLDPNTPSVFYLMVPPGTYSSFSVAISTADSGMMIKETNNQLKLERSHIKHTGTLEFVECEFEDLSKFGNANSYLVTEAGNYSFDATIIGNGGYGLIEGANFHTQSPFITPASAELLWQDTPGVVSIVNLNGGNVCFKATGTEGNAVVAVKDEYGTILWSWHIWVTDEPQEHLYNGMYVMMDRALGSISAVEGDYGGALYYQWGRKDPFMIGESYVHSTHECLGQFANLSAAIANPNAFGVAEDWVQNLGSLLWSTDTKTIYDPCPIGWRVPSRYAWNGLGVKHDRDGGPYGVVLNCYEQDYFWYPDTPRVGWGANVEGSYTDDNTEFWTSERGTTKYVRYDGFSENGRCNGDGHPVRCMKDESFENSLPPMVTLLSFTDIHSEGVTINAAVTAEGIFPVTERGIIWGTTSELDYNSPNRQIVEGGLGEYSLTLTGLENATKYYVRAYAINDYDISYSDVKSFNTPHDGNVFDLSLDGTANCYIVEPVYGEYAFNATVKGNSDEPVGEIDEAVVLWETELGGYMNEHYSINKGDIIADATFKEGRVHFTLPFDPKLGNALIAVKDVDGNILWSWHIWVTDLDLDKTPAKLNSGAVIMDRNLGALTMENGNIQSYGLYYQWGRKDPFTAYNYMYTAPYDAITYEYGNASIETAVKNPTIVYNDAQWDGNQNLWGKEKTMYDPCPSGWKVPMPAVLEDMRGNAINGSYEVTTADRYLYFPYSGYTSGDDNYMGHTEWGFYWTSTYRYATRVHRWTSYPDHEYYDVDYVMSVRCMKDEEKPVTGDGNDLEVDDKYEW